MDEQLLRSFDEPGSAAWSVHADALQARGDARGELIAVELRLDHELPDAEREALEARAARLRAPYVEAFEQRIGPRGAKARWRFGYLQRVHLYGSWKLRERLPIVLDGEYSRFLTGLSLDFYPKHLPVIVELLGASARPIESLRLDFVHAFGHDEPIDAADAAELMDVLPRLRSLDLAGRRAFEQLEHPTLERLRLSGHDAIIGLPDAALPRLRALDLALVCGWGVGRGPRSGLDPGWLAALLDGPTAASLRLLDLSRNNPGALEYTSFLGGDDPGVLFEVLARTRVCGRLRRLLLPSPNDPRIHAAREQLVKVPGLRMPTLYPWFSPERARLLEWLPTLDIEREFPHRPFGVIAPHEGILANLIGDDETRVAVQLSARRFARLLEDRLAHLTTAARAVLGEFFDRFAVLELDAELALELPRFRDAFAELIRDLPDEPTRDLPDEPARFVDVLASMNELGERGSRITFARVIE